MATLNPGDVALSDLVAGRDRSRAAESAEPQPLILHLAVPIFNAASGELFGAVGLQIDLEYLLAEWSRDTVVAADVLLADRAGRVMAVFEPDSGRDFGARPDASRALRPEGFVSGRQSELKVPPSVEQPGGMFAIKVPL